MSCVKVAVSIHHLVWGVARSVRYVLAATALSRSDSACIIALVLNLMRRSRRKELYNSALSDSESDMKPVWVDLVAC